MTHRLYADMEAVLAVQAAAALERGEDVVSDRVRRDGVRIPRDVMSAPLERQVSAAYGPGKPKLGALSTSESGNTLRIVPPGASHDG